MHEEINPDRRRFLSTAAALTVAGAGLGAINAVRVQSASTQSFAPLKQIDAGAYAKKFSGKYTHRLVKGGIGHNVPQEAPRAFADAVVDVDRL